MWRIRVNTVAVETQQCALCFFHSIIKAMISGGGGGVEKKMGFLVFFIIF